MRVWMAQRPYARAAPERRTASAESPPAASAGKTAPRLSRNRPESSAQSSQNSPRLVPTGTSAVRDHRGEQEVFALVEPGEVGLLAREETGYGVHQYRRGRPSRQAAGLFARQPALDPALACATGGAQGSLAPGDANTPGPFGPVVGRRAPVLDEKAPEGV